LPLDHNSLFLLLGKIAAALTALATIWKFVGAPLYRFSTNLGTLPAKVDQLAAQFTRNGGATLRDSIERIEVLTARGEQRDRILLGLVPYGILEFDGAGICILLNRTYVRWTGRDEKEILGRGWINALHPRDRERVSREWTNALVENRNYETTFTLHNPDSDLSIFVACKIVPMRPGIKDNEPPIGYLAILHREEHPHED
jgi:PAS domain S-box-containing protein